MKAPTVYSLLSVALAGHVRTIRKGRSVHSAGFSRVCPVAVVPGSDAGPVLSGLPYLKTTFRNGPRFSRTLYTPSTLSATVGAQWLASRGASLPSLSV